MIPVILAYVITYLWQVKNDVGQIRNHLVLARHGKLVLRLMLVPDVFVCFRLCPGLPAVHRLVLFMYFNNLVIHCMCLFVSDFAQVCQQSTDFHFPDLEQQFANIEGDVVKANEWRTQKRLSEDGDRISVKSSSSSSSDVRTITHLFFYLNPYAAGG